MMIPHERLVDIFKALSDPNRLRLFECLLESDQTNTELMNEVGLSQNLLSHHLSVLVDVGLISVRQSIGDARRRYYIPNMEVPHLLSLWWWQQGLAVDRPCPPLRHPKTVLFLCRKNAARSLIAEAMTRAIAPQTLIPYSAGIDAGTMPAQVLEGLARCGISGDGLYTKQYPELPTMTFDYLITVCDRVHEPGLPPELSYRRCLHWSMVDPEEANSSEEDFTAAMDALCDEIRHRLMLFAQRVAAQDAADAADADVS
ncbi:MAG TPA: metalloregulator ArsR/SmtB family transcription factor [Aggregatilinea sp.]|uniref:metalloregulator ArsR/SmtB family transcription factor n=1 Tax=Aggregatilinea sp. TaxID=2806333 RepID=UPI002BE5AFF5|nr:metalloregulator ArsR/SmtB family transcription factor [Aggregatilinea sp.]HML24619.1 metalloregulator ArsR/SmtB family transcription factor [Aggregatilinea sp.]